MTRQRVDPPRGTEAATVDGWALPLFAMLLLQSTGAFLMQLLPTLAPLLSADFGWNQTFIGYIATTSMVGALTFLVVGGPLARANGPIRSVQLGLALGGAGIFLLFIPAMATPILAGFLMGLAYGPTMPAGSQVLQRYAPARHRSLIFSIKQTGVPIGGALAGVTLPGIAAFAGWRGALVFAALVVVATVALVQPMRRRIDHDPVVAGEVEPAKGRRILMRPLASLRSSPRLLRLAMVGGFVAFNQGGWTAFLVTFLVVRLDFGLSAAGAVMAIMQVGAVVGRIGLGWLADHIGSGVAVLRGAAIASGLTSLALVGAVTFAPYWIIAPLAFFAGMTVTGWNGIHLAELARRSPHGRVGDVSAGGMILVSLGLLLGPSVYAAIVAVTGSFATAFVVLGLAPIAASLLIFGREPAAGETRRIA